MWRAQKELNQLRKEEKGPVGTYRGSAKSLAAMATREEDGEGVGGGALAWRLLCGQLVVCVFRSLVQACGWRD